MGREACTKAGGSQVGRLAWADTNQWHEWPLGDILRMPDGAS